MNYRSTFQSDEIDIDISDYGPHKSQNNSTSSSKFSTNTCIAANKKAPSTSNDTFFNTTSCSIYTPISNVVGLSNNQSKINLPNQFINDSDNYMSTNVLNTIDFNGDKADSESDSTKSNFETNFAYEKALRISKLKQEITQHTNYDKLFPKKIIQKVINTKNDNRKNRNAVNNKTKMANIEQENSDMESITLLIKVPKSKLINHIKNKSKSKHQSSSSDSLESTTSIDDSNTLKLKDNKENKSSQDEDEITDSINVTTKTEKNVKLKENKAIQHHPQKEKDNCNDDEDDDNDSDEDDDDDEETKSFSNITSLIDRSRQILREYQKTLLKNGTNKCIKQYHIKETRQTQTDFFSETATYQKQISKGTTNNFLHVSIANEEDNYYNEYFSRSNSETNQNKALESEIKTFDNDVPPYKSHPMSNYFLCNICHKIVPGNLSPICQRRPCAAVTTKCDQVFHSELDMVMHLPVSHVREFSSYKICALCNRMYHPTHVVTIRTQVTCLNCLEARGIR